MIIDSKEIQPALPSEKENTSGETKHYYFETETKRLKEYYQTNQEGLIGRKILFNNNSGIVRYFGLLKH